MVTERTIQLNDVVQEYKRLLEQKIVGKEITKKAEFENDKVSASFVFLTAFRYSTKTRKYLLQKL